MNRCPVCDSTELRSVLHLADVPIFCNVLYDTRDEAAAARTGEIALVGCNRCGMVFNEAFDETLVTYEGSYENSLHFSPTFREYADDLAQYLADEYDLDGGLVVEIGCGEGEFLARLCEVAGSRGLGFDPSFQGAVDHPNVEIVASELPDRLDSTPDLVIFRHVLEHLSQPVEFLTAVRRTLAGGATAIYCEVPSGEFVLGDSLWDVIYEHFGYFTEASLQRAFTRVGLTTGRVARTFGGQFLSIEARNSDSQSADEEAGHFPATQSFGSLNTASETLGAWSSRIAKWADANLEVALWGIGSKGVTFLNLVDGADQAIEALIDVNPRKQGKYVPRVARPVQTVDRLRKGPLDKVLVANPIYRDEIEREIATISSEAGYEMPELVTLI